MLLLAYAIMLFGHALASGIHSLLHLTADIIAIHDHGHLHDVDDHSEVLEEMETEASKSAFFNMLSLTFCFFSYHQFTIQHSRFSVTIAVFNYIFESSLFISPPKPPPDQKYSPNYTFV